MTAISSLAYKDLRGYLDAVDKLGELRKVDGADWDLEIGAITEVAARAANPKVVLFDHIKDYPKGFRVVTNPVCSAPTTALAFGLDPKLAGLDLIRAWKQKLGGQTPLKAGRSCERADHGECRPRGPGRLAQVSHAALARTRRRPLHRHGLHGDHGRSGGQVDQRRHLSRLRA